jgi:hypothetical protein
VGNLPENLLIFAGFMGKLKQNAAAGRNLCTPGRTPAADSIDLRKKLETCQKNYNKSLRSCVMRGERETKPSRIVNCRSACGRRKIVDKLLQQNLQNLRL